VRDLIDGKGPLLRRQLEDGDAWRFHYAVFSRGRVARTGWAGCRPGPFGFGAGKNGTRMTRILTDDRG
jgi:hypothetical protein